MQQLEVTIPDSNYFFSLYAEGKHCFKFYDRQKKHTVLHYPPESAAFLYYTYPTHREACVIRNDGSENGIMLPCLSKKVSRLFSVTASKVDKLKRAAFYLNEHSGAGAYGFDDGFYTRLGYLLEQRGKINYPALRGLFESSLKENQFILF